ncbi:MAG: ATPase, T2SS/T4P/T4SS family [Candidatus Micrarchaeaceae archaeon]
MIEKPLLELEKRILTNLKGKLLGLNDNEKKEMIFNEARRIDASASKEDIEKIYNDIFSYGPIGKYLSDESVEDIMVNNTKNMFVYVSGKGSVKVEDAIRDREELDLIVKKMALFATTSSEEKIFDMHLPNGSRANVVESPLGPNITIRNFKGKALSIIDLINLGELSYNLAARLWLYAEGLKVRPANLVIGGLPAAGKTTLLNAMFSFFRPEARVITIEETYELYTDTQENCVRLETAEDVTMADLVKAALRMRPDIIIIGEVRGSEAKDMMTAMNIGKISMTTIHASTARDIVTRLQHSPMNVEMDIVPLIDALIVVSQVNEYGKYVRKITQVSEISGIETQILLSDLYKYDYKTHKSSEVLPSISYRDTLSKLTGYHPTEIILEEQRRARILEELNKRGMRDVHSINEFCKAYYDDQESALSRLGLEDLGTLPW